MASSLLSPPNSPMDHRHYIPRRPSPLSLPPVGTPAPSTTHTSMGFDASTSSYQPFSLSEFAVATPRTGARIPRYPLEKQRRALKELEQEQQRKRQSQQMQRQAPMGVPGRNGSCDSVMLSPTTTLPLTPRSGASSVSNYSQEAQHTQERRAPSYRNPALAMCATVFGSCFASLSGPAKRLDTMNMNMRTIASAR
ncbi:hypothetical protein DFP72DRAFT_851922 [Ephemerocybe angulata]|uniref:Uncharacterized protein n=1 Tax=Ephemerocybe angulata TaxID=980116 RepID=A0A8H6HNE2_9AGAR|nr:hypothetical protein DFP72DRAFT_851922 [Tulosesus angulatus]